MNDTCRRHNNKTNTTRFYFTLIVQFTQNLTHRKVTMITYHVLYRM